MTDENIDYDSSFEVVEDEKFEKIEDLDDTKSESFQFISARGVTTKEVNIDLDESSIPITTAILGKWKPISSNNLEGYFKAQKLSELTELAWEHGIVCYEMKEGVLHVHTELLNKTLSATTFQIGVRIDKANSSVICKIENNGLNTVCTKITDGTVSWKVERSIKNGKLIIINQQGEFNCERIYERVK